MTPERHFWWAKQFWSSWQRIAVKANGADPELLTHQRHLFGQNIVYHLERAKKLPRDLGISDVTWRAFVT